jgi:GNAT superfamily N-acetyltransferase
MVIRRAEARDLDAVCRLYVAFHEFHVRGVPTRLATLGDPATFDCATLVHTLAHLVAKPEAVLLVAEVDQDIVGLAEVYVRHDVGDPPKLRYRYGYVQSLMVGESARGHGIGTALMTAAEHWAKSQGASEMRLETWEFPAGPLPFYEAAGYHTLRRVLVRPL